MINSRLQVVVDFGEDISPEAQGVALLHLEKELRKLTKQDIRVFKKRMGDDSKLRVKMTLEERERL